MVAERRCLEQVGRKENNRGWGLSSPLACMASGKASGGSVERIFRNKCKDVSKSEPRVSALSFVMPTYACLGMMATNSYAEAYNWHMISGFIHYEFAS